MRTSLRVAAGLCCGAGAWASLGVIALVPRDGAFDVVGLLPTIVWLAAAVAAGVAIALR